jgi:hypothetical protein
MKMLKILLVPCIILAFAAPANSQKKDKQVERPFKGTFYATVIGQASSTVEILSISGHATHIGNFTGTMYFDKTTIGYNPTTHGIELTGVYTSGTIVAANGAEIEFGPDNPGMVVTGPGPSGIMSGEVTLKPGTGRFANCSGVITTTGIFDMGNDYAKWTAEGWIKY